MDSTTMTRVMAVLERRGWVARRAGVDKRQRIYAITADGRRQVEAARAGWRRAQERLGSALGPETLAALTEATARMSAVR
jgi:DNA-binding MarR family transcriptional regulator